MFENFPIDFLINTVEYKQKIPFLRYIQDPLGLTIDMIDIKNQKIYDTKEKAFKAFMIKLLNNKNVFCNLTNSPFKNILEATNDILSKTKRNLAKKIIITRLLAVKMSGHMLTSLDTDGDDNFKLLGMDSQILDDMNHEFAILYYEDRKIEDLDCGAAICGNEHIGYRLAFNKSWERYYRVLIKNSEKNIENSVQFMWNMMFGD